MSCYEMFKKHMISHHARFKYANVMYCTRNIAKYVMTVPVTAKKNLKSKASCIVLSYFWINMGILTISYLYATP